LPESCREQSVSCGHTEKSRVLLFISGQAICIPDFLHAGHKLTVAVAGSRQYQRYFI